MLVESIKVNKIVRDSVILFLLAVFTRIGYIYFFVDIEYLSIEDQSLYVQLAQQLTESGFLGVGTERMPGYPLFIASIYSFFGENIWNIILVQILVDSASCVMIALTAQLLFGRGFFIAGGISVINLNMIMLSSSLLTDTLFLFLFVMFIFSLFQYLKNEKITWLFLLIIFISLATLVRSFSSYLLPILLISLVGWRVWKKDSFLKISMLVTLHIIIIGILLGGVYQRNYQQYDSIALSSQTGGHVLGWVVPATYQYSGQGDYQEGQELAKRGLASALQRDKLEALSLNPFKSSSYQTNVGKDVLFELGFLNILKAWVVGSTINLLAPSVAYAPALRAMEHPSFYETEGNGIVEKLFNYIKHSSGFLYLSILAVGTIISVIFTMLALIGVFKMISRLPPITVTTLLFLVGYFIAITGPIIGVKYRLPIEPILTLFATYFLNRIVRK
jgi:4-amino-4-deoxy-L-arabinose transferase-like glycosyltransferase